MENDIKSITETIKEEISLAPEVDGLCYYASNNIVHDLNELGIDALMFNIREMADVNYNHYFVLVNSNEKYLIDLAYRQFVKEAGKEVRFFNNFPSEFLESTKEGQTILNKLLTLGYFKTTDDEFYLYLQSFNPNLEIFFTLDDIMPSKRRKNNVI